MMTTISRVETAFQTNLIEAVPFGTAFFYRELPRGYGRAECGKWRIAVLPMVQVPNFESLTPGRTLRKENSLERTF